MKQTPDQQRSFMIALLLAAALIVLLQVFVEAPKRRELARWQAAHAKKQEQVVKTENPVPPQTREQLLATGPRVHIASPMLHGSIALTGLKFDDLTLARYRTSLTNDSTEVVLFAPKGEAHGYFAQAGWVNAAGGNAKLPDENTVWKADGETLTPEHPVTFTWANGDGLTFRTRVALDANYMFTLTQDVQNSGQAAAALSPYALINRAYGVEEASGYFEGPIGAVGGELKEIKYDTLKKEGDQSADTPNGWLGFSDKYWLAALVPDSEAGGYKASFRHYQAHGADRWQTESLGKALEAAPGQTATNTLRLFAGAKEVTLLDAYATGNSAAGLAPIPLFDRAVDFGMLYFLTRPMFLLLNFFSHFSGNYGIAILLLTLTVRVLMFPIAHKGYGSSVKMKRLQPEMLRLREAHGGDKLRMQQEIMALYKREKFNPASGCLPLLLQLPVFLALSRALSVSIELRHAPFFGWIRDLSVADPSNVFTLFGLIPWVPPAFLHVGILPIIMCLLTVLQMRLQPTQMSPDQAKAMKLMPYFILFIFAHMAAGLLIYCIFSLLFSIFQQFVIMAMHGDKRTAPGVNIQGGA